MKFSIKHIFFLLVSGSMLSSCLPDPAEEALVYQGPTVVEFKNHTLGMVASSLTAPKGLDVRGILSTTGSVQTDSSRVISLEGYTTSSGRVISPRTVDTIYVQLVGPQRSTATEVSFEPFNAGFTTPATPTTPEVVVKDAVEGTDYTLEPAGARKVTIPANSSVGYLLIRPNVTSFTGTERKRVGFRLVGSADAAANPNYDAFYVTMTRTF